MPKEIHLWQVDRNRLIPIADARLELERRLEEWLTHDITLLGKRLLVIGRQVETDFGGYVDLLCLDATGDVVVVELKRDRTPREVTAQLLDYASWVADLSAERIDEIASHYLDSSLEIAFQRVFETELPEVINESHQLLLVGTMIDPASERIIRYLSDRHGVSINAVTFQFFRLETGQEVVGRVHLLEPQRVAQNVTERANTRRRVALTLEELEGEADERGIGPFYRQARELFRPLFSFTQTSRSSLRLAGRFGERTGAVLNLIPRQSQSGGLPFQLYTNRASQLFGRTPEEIAAALPPGTQPWSYDSGDDPWWKGHAGVFHNLDECRRLQQMLDSAAVPVS